MMPKLTSDSPKVALSEAMAKSQSPMTRTAAPKHQPFTAAMVGLGQSRSLSPHSMAMSVIFLASRGRSWGSAKNSFRS